MAVASLILGIVSVLSSVVGGCFSLGWVGSACGVVAIILGAIARKNPAKKGMATAGLVLGIIALAWGIIATIACVTCLAGVASLGSSYY